MGESSSLMGLFNVLFFFKITIIIQSGGASSNGNLFFFRNVIIFSLKIFFIDTYLAYYSTAEGRHFSDDLYQPKEGK